jgi:hypothetical protein
LTARAPRAEPICFRPRWGHNNDQSEPGRPVHGMSSLRG